MPRPESPHVPKRTGEHNSRTAAGTRVSFPLAAATVFRPPALCPARRLRPQPFPPQITLGKGVLRGFQVRRSRFRRYIDAEMHRYPATDTPAEQECLLHISVISKPFVVKLGAFSSYSKVLMKRIGARSRPEHGNVEDGVQHTMLNPLCTPNPPPFRKFNLALG